MSQQSSSSAERPLPALPPNLVLSAVEPSDGPGIGPLFISAFHAYPFFQHLYPASPEANLGFDGATKFGIDDPLTISLKITDTERDNEIVAHGRWIKPRPDGQKEQPGHEEGRWDSFAACADPKLTEEMFGAFERNREEMMGDKLHYYMELLFVHPEYQGRGLAKHLLKPGFDLADRDGLPCYIDASSGGRKLYESCGFVWRNEEEFSYGMKYYFGVRELRGTGGSKGE